MLHHQTQYTERQAIIRVSTRSLNPPTLTLKSTKPLCIRRDYTQLRSIQRNHTTHTAKNCFLYNRKKYFDQIESDFLRITTGSKELAR